jgi:hypothetical protein
MIDKNVELCKQLINTVIFQLSDTTEDRHLATLTLVKSKTDGITKGLLDEYEKHIQYLNEFQKRLQKDYEALLRR